MKDFLDVKVDYYNRPEFIETDPIQIPHRFTLPQDIEISGIIAASLAWGQRKTIISKSAAWMCLMNNHPYDFLLNAGIKDYARFEGFCHRTFNATDTLYFLHALKNIYLNHGGLREVFEEGFRISHDAAYAIARFRRIFFESDHLVRTRKHVPDVAKGAAAKRINMFLRWMVRCDNKGVDFGLWTNISPVWLKIPLDLHTAKTARRLELLERKQNDWKAVCELTETLCKFDPCDPVKYDFALFGLSATPTGCYKKTGGMSNPYFEFKQFTVYHDRCAMKVGTDGVLLGAWVNVAGAVKILDVGTGTGLIALMMAQRSEGIIHGVEMDGKACLQADENVKRSPWSGRITLFHNTFQQFARDGAESYDLVVSNPPYFRNSLKPPAQNRSMARHDDHLSYENLLFFASGLLSAAGRLAVILPAGGFSDFERIARFYGLYPLRLTRVRPHPGKEHSRCLAEFSRSSTKDYQCGEFTIRGNDHCYTKEYIELTRDFYLKMAPE